MVYTRTCTKKQHTLSQLELNLDFKHGLGHQSHECSSNIYVATFDNKTVISFVPGLRAWNIQRIVNLSLAISSLSYAFSVMNLRFRNTLSILRTDIARAKFFNIL